MEASKSWRKVLHTPASGWCDALSTGWEEPEWNGRIRPCERLDGMGEQCVSVCVSVRGRLALGAFSFRFWTIVWSCFSGLYVCASAPSGISAV